MWYNSNVFKGGILMSKEEKFEFDIANLRKDLAIENMFIKEEDIQLLRRYFNKEITMVEMIELIKKSAVQGV